jgi:hypothetical protein
MNNKYYNYAKLIFRRAAGCAAAIFASGASGAGPNEKKCAENQAKSRHGRQKAKNRTIILTQ